MNKDKILEAARKKENRSDEYEYKVEENASLLTLIAIIVVIFVLSVNEYIATRTVNFGFFTIAVTALATDSMYKGIALKKAWRIAVGVILMVVALIMIIAQAVLA